MLRNIILILFSSLVLVACKKTPDVKGRYFGTLTINGTAQQVVTEVPDFKEHGEYQVLEFSLYETKASANPNHVIVQASSDSIVIKSSFLGADDYKLGALKDSCGSGEKGNTLATLCFQSEKIDFTLKEKTSGNTILTLNLARSADLPTPTVNGTYSIDDLVGRAKFNAYAVSQEAERVFQARQKVKMAIANLLPHFNMKDLLAFSGGPMGGIQAIGSFVPFIFPSNWYKMAEVKELSRAQQKSFASLRGNEMQYVENFVYLVQRDLLLKNLMQDELVKQREVHRIIAKKEQYGQLPPKSADKYYSTVLMIEQDLVQLGSLIDFELSSLAHAVALPATTGISVLEAVPVPDLSKIPQIDYKSLIETAKTKSFEVKTLEFLVEASKKSTKATVWGFLDPNSSDYIGFGLASQLNVGESQVRTLESKRDETLSLIEQRVFIGASEYNATLTSFNIATAGVVTSKGRLDRLAKRLKSGDEKVDDEYFVQEIAEATQSLLKFSANQLSAAHSYMISRSKLNRLVLEGYYKDLELTKPE